MKFSSLAALKVVKMTTSSAASDENFIKMTTFSFQWYSIWLPIHRDVCTRTQNTPLYTWHVEPYKFNFSGVKLEYFQLSLLGKTHFVQNMIIQIEHMIVMVAFVEDDKDSASQPDVSVCHLTFNRREPLMTTDHIVTPRGKLGDADRQIDWDIHTAWDTQLWSTTGQSINLP